MSMQKSNKVLYISHSAEIKGAELCLLNLIKQVDRQRFTPVVVLPSEGPLKDKIDSLGIKTYTSPLEWWVGLEGGYRLTDFTLAERVHSLKEIISAENPDIVQTNTSVVLEGALAAFEAGIPHIWHIHEIMDGHPSLSPMLPLPLFYRVIDELSRNVVTVSHTAKQELSKYIAPEKIVVIHNGIDPSPPLDSESYSLRAELALAEDSTIAITVATVCKYKGQDNLVRAIPAVLKKNPNLHFVLAGPAAEDYLQSIMALARELGVEKNLHYLGFRSDIPRLLAQCDLFVLPSVKEAFPLVVLEAMAAGKAVVATDCCGPSEMIEEGVSGFVVPVNDPQALAANIGAIAADQPTLLAMGKRGKEIFQQNFTVTSYATAFANFYEMTKGNPSHVVDPLWANAFVLMNEKYVRAEKESLRLNKAVNHLKKQLERQLTKAEKDVAERDIRIASIYDSLSWRVTAPLRWFADKIFPKK